MSIVLIDSSSDSLTVSWPETLGATSYVLQFRKAPASSSSSPPDQEGETPLFETLHESLSTTQARKRNLLDPDGHGFLFRVAANLARTRTGSDDGRGGDTATNKKAWTTHPQPFRLLSDDEERRRMARPTVGLAGRHETLLISWTKPSSVGANGNGRSPLAYELQMRENVPGGAWSTVAASLAGTEARKKHLTSPHGYQFRVRVVSDPATPFSPPSEPAVALGLSPGLRSLFKTLDGGNLLQSTTKIPLADALGGKEFVLLYASAHWCPPCRKYTPVLSQWYQSLGPNRTVEVVFLSADREDRGFRDYYRQMPWLAVNFDDDTREQLMAHIKVSGIPRLAVLDGRTGRIVEDNAVGQSLDVARWRALASKK